MNFRKIRIFIGSKSLAEISASRKYIWSKIFASDFGQAKIRISSLFQSIFKGLDNWNKLGCTGKWLTSVVDSILPHVECGPNDYRKDAPPFTIYHFTAIFFMFSLERSCWSQKQEMMHHQFKIQLRIHLLMNGLAHPKMIV